MRSLLFIFSQGKADMRLDVFLTDNGYADSRTRAARLIADGCVFVNGQAVTKPSFSVLGNETFSVADNMRYVSRGGYKLEGALDKFEIDVSKMTALDIGASSGGFTDCLLQRGASFVFALDSGTNQLAESLRCDPRVAVMEKCNARYMKKEDFSKKIEIAVMDVSFISQRLILPAIYDVLSTEGILVSLVKPQFEAGREHIGKGGIVKDEKIRQRALSDVTDFAVSLGFCHMGSMLSPIKGGDGNIEYLAVFKKTEELANE